LVGNNQGQSNPRSVAKREGRVAKFHPNASWSRDNFGRDFETVKRIFVERKTVANAFDNGADKLTVDEFAAVKTRGNNTDLELA
jgi:hypothetical protein